jgi:hypothetical protein
MALVARILGISLLTSVLVAGIAIVLLGSIAPRDPSSSGPVLLIIIALFFGCIGGVIGGVAGAAREIVSAQRPKVSDWSESK